MGLSGETGRDEKDEAEEEGVEEEQEGRAIRKIIRGNEERRWWTEGEREGGHMGAYGRTHDRRMDRRTHGWTDRRMDGQQTHQWQDVNHSFMTRLYVALIRGTHRQKRASRIFLSGHPVLVLASRTASVHVDLRGLALQNATYHIFRTSSVKIERDKSY